MSSLTSPPLADWESLAPPLGAALGRSVSSAGDVNGDGFDDLIVGADAYTGGQTQEGAALIWYGGAAGLNAGPQDVLLEIEGDRHHLVSVNGER